MLLDAVIARLKAEVPPLQNRVEDAAAFSAMLEKQSVAQRAPMAFIMPLGIQGGPADASAGLYRQTNAETIAVMLLARHAGSAAGGEALASLGNLIDPVIAALAGWAPSPASFGDFRLARGALMGFLASGTVLYQLDFTISTQLRITT